MTNQAPPDWYKDPHGRYELRFWDGAVWTDQVSSQGVQGLDQLSTNAYKNSLQSHPQQIQAGSSETSQLTRKNKLSRTVRKVGIYREEWSGGGSLLGESILVTYRIPKFREKIIEYVIHDGYGNQLATVKEVNVNFIKNIIIPLAEATRIRHFEIRDNSGYLFYSLHRSFHLTKPNIQLFDGSKNIVGTVQSKGLLSSKSFLKIGSVKLGEITYPVGRSSVGSVRTPDGTKVANITNLPGERGKPNRYVTEILHQGLIDPMLGFVVTAAAVADLINNIHDPRETYIRQKKHRRGLR